MWMSFLTFPAIVYMISQASAVKLISIHVRQILVSMKPLAQLDLLALLIVCAQMASRDHCVNSILMIVLLIHALMVVFVMMKYMDSIVHVRGGLVEIFVNLILLMTVELTHA